MSPRSGVCLAARDLYFRYGDAASEFELEVPEFALEWGRSVACIGPSGRGKTTLAMLLAGVFVPNRGCVTFDDTRLSELDEASRRRLRIERFGLVFQELELIPWLTARENVLLPYRTSHALRLDDAARARADELAERMGVRHLLSRHPERLSQGERQRIAVCRALVTRPDVVFCDEPTGNLDPERARAILDLLREELRASGASFFCITHDHALLDRFDDVFDLDTLVVSAREGGGDA